MTATSPRFSGNNLRLARAYQGLTQAELGAQVEASAAYICQLEAEQRHPTEELLHALGEILGFEPSFFLLPLRDEFRDEQCHFRRRKTTPNYVRNRLLAFGTLFSTLVDYLDSVLSLPPASIPSINARGREAIEEAAEACRGHWKLGDDVPIRNMTRAIERAGVVTTRYEAQTLKIDAFSRVGRRSVVVLNADKGSASRSRYDLAHECGHLVLHQGKEAGAPEMEDEANIFASAFLLPRKGFRREFQPVARIDFNSLLSLKRRWGVSVAAIIRRAYDLSLLSPVQYRRAYQQLHYRGWDKGEPAEPVMEAPEVMPRAFDALQAMGIAPADVARHLSWSPGVMTEVSGQPCLPSDEPGNVVALNGFRKTRKQDR